MAAISISSKHGIEGSQAPPVSILSVQLAKRTIALARSMIGADEQLWAECVFHIIDLCNGQEATIRRGLNGLALVS
jgi:hypothetical protein